MSATSNRNSGKTFDSPDRPPLRDADNTRDRFSFRNKAGDGEDERSLEGRNALLRPKRAEGDQDSDGWSTVKPRKSFGTEGAERFNGRMGVDRNHDDKRDDIRRDDRRREDGREDRRFRDREERTFKDRPARGFDTFSRDKDGDHDQPKDSSHRNGGLGRGRGDSWFNRDNDTPISSTRDRNSNGDKFVDRSRGWREKDNTERGEGRGGERGNDRGENKRGERNDRGDRRWGNRDERQERDPEWMDEPANGKVEAHTQEDFQKWKESMRKETSGAGKPEVEENSPKEPSSKTDASASFFGLEKPKVDTPLAIDTGPDKFFGMWAAPKEDATPDSVIESKKEGPAKGKQGGKASRFTSFFTPQDEPLRRQTDPPPMPQPPNGLGALFQSSGQNPDDKAAFQQLLQKLHLQSGGSGTTPPVNAQQQPKPPAPEKQRSDPMPPPPEAFQQYRVERQEERPVTNSRNSQQALQELLVQRSVAGSQQSVRPEQMLQELVGQRQNALSQGSQRPDPGRSNSDFLMGLMRNIPQPQRTEEALLRMPPKPAMDRQQLQLQMAHEQEMQHREAAAREQQRVTAQRQARPQPPPGFFDDAAYHRAPQHERQPQPTQILQRPPPGLDQVQPGWAQSPGGLGPQQIRHNIAPPPGLAGRGMPMPQQQMFPPGYFPPADGRMQPPPGFFNPPPPGFMPPGMGGFQGPEGMPFGAPYDGRGPPPQGAFRR
jgi:hypothetical protein